MPRRNYDPRNGRRRPHGYDGVALQRLVDLIAYDAAQRRRQTQNGWSTR